MSGVARRSLIRPVPCPLCGGPSTPWAEDRYARPVRRSYLRCSVCRFVSVPSHFHLTARQERARYEEHENRPEDAAYLAFLAPLFEAMNRRLPSGSSGLDFGSGPGPALFRLFRDAGHHVVNYDLYFDRHPERLRQAYDFIVSSETAEHLRDPRRELHRLWSLIRPGGWLGIMTLRIPEAVPFCEWFYKNDDTHIGFFADESFEWLAGRWGARAEFEGERVVLFQKPTGDGAV